MRKSKGKAGRGAVAAGHPVTAEAAAQVLKEGGNAFDAAVAGMAAACVAEPVLASLGGGGFLLAAPKDRDPVFYDFFVQTPRRKRPSASLDFAPVDCDFGPATQRFHVGLGAAATPGVAAGLFAVHQDLARLPVRDLLAPAIRAARDGVAWRPFEGYAFGVVGGIWRYSQDAARLIAAFDAERPLRQPELADTLEALAAEGQGLFYKGEVSARIATLSRERGGHLTREDFERYQVKPRPPLAVEFAGRRIWTAPPPSSGGLLIAFALRLMEALGEQAASALTLAKAMAATNKARLESGLARAESAVEEEAAMARLLSPDLKERYREEILGRPASLRGTTHLSVADGEGNLAAATLSNGEGCGHLIPGTGIHLNNMLGEEDLNPRGFHSWTPDTRMVSMMAPSLARLEEGAAIALGSGGSNRLRTAILQVLMKRLTGGLSLREAVDAPRLHLEGDRLSFEPGAVSETERAALGETFDLDPWPEPSMFFGGVHSVEDHGDGTLKAAADPRRAGVAVVL